MRLCVSIVTPRRHSPADCQSAIQQATSLVITHIFCEKFPTILMMEPIRLAHLADRSWVLSEAALPSKAPGGWRTPRRWRGASEAPCARSVLECGRPSAAFVLLTAMNGYGSCAVRKSARGLDAVQDAGAEEARLREREASWSAGGPPPLFHRQPGVLIRP